MKTRIERVLDVLRLASEEGMTVDAIVSMLSHDKPITRNAVYVMLSTLKGQGKVTGRTVVGQWEKRWHVSESPETSDVAANLDWATRLLASKRIPLEERYIPGTETITEEETA